MHEFIAITYFVTAAGFILITRALNRRPFTKNLFNPILIFGVAYALVYLAIPGLQIYRQQYQYSAEYSPDALLASLFCFIAFG